MRQLPHAGQQPAGWPLPDQHPARVLAAARNRAASRSSGRGGLALVLTGSDVSQPARRAAQCSITGQGRHRGDFGVQTSAPSSISAWLKCEASLRDQPAASRSIFTRVGPLAMSSSIRK